MRFAAAFFGAKWAVRDFLSVSSSSRIFFFLVCSVLLRRGVRFLYANVIGFTIKLRPPLLSPKCCASRCDMLHERSSRCDTTRSHYDIHDRQREGKKSNKKNWNLLHKLFFFFPLHLWCCCCFPFHDESMKQVRNKRSMSILHLNVMLAACKCSCLPFIPYAHTNTHTEILLSVYSVVISFFINRFVDVNTSSQGRIGDAGRILSEDRQAVSCSRRQSRQASKKCVLHITGHDDEEKLSSCCLYVPNNFSPPLPFWRGGVW